MPFTVEYAMTRPNKNVEFPAIGGSEKDNLSALREEYNVTSEILYSSDGLVRTSRHTTPTMEDYTNFYEQAQSHWTKSNFVEECSRLDIQLSMSVVENN